MKSVWGLHYFVLVLSLGLCACGKKPSEGHTEQNPVEVKPIPIENPLPQKNNDLFEAVKINDYLKAQEIIQSQGIKLDLNKLQENGDTLLITAVKLGNFQLVELLIDSGASIYVPNTNGRTPLMTAAVQGDETLARYFLVMRARLDAKDKDGNTALLLAIINKRESLALMLIKSGANIDITNNQNENALKLAEKNQTTEVLDILRGLTQSIVSLPERGTYTTLLEIGDIINLKQMLTKYPQIIAEYESVNPYVLMMQNTNLDLVRYMAETLLMFGADVNGPKDAEITPLIQSVKLGNLSLSRFFLRDGKAKPNLMDQEGKTALIWAVSMNNRPMVELLVEYGAHSKYVYYQEGIKKEFNACEVGTETRKSLQTRSARETNEKILSTLSCRWRRFL